MREVIVWVLLALFCVSCGTSSSGDIDYNLIPVQQGGRFGYIDPKGEYVINPQFDDATMFREGIARVKKDGKYGYIRKDGSYLCLPTYISATPFQEGIAWVVKEKGAPTAIDVDGKELFTVKESYSVFCYSEGFAGFSVRTDDGDIKWGYLDKKGKVVIPPIYKEVGFFSQGLASVKDNNHLSGYIDVKGNLKIAHQYANGEKFNKSGLAIVQTTGDDDLYGVINKDGKFVINPQFATLIPDNDGFLVQMEKHGDFGYCDTKGKLTINPQFAEASTFGNGELAPVLVGGSVGYINKKGIMVIPPQFEAATFFVHNYALASSGKKIGIINQEGKYVVNPQFQSIANDFSYNVDEIKNTPFIRVESQYIDIDKIVDKIETLLANNMLDGMSFPPTVEEIQVRYKIEDSKMPVYSDLETYLGYWGQNISARLILNGYFYKEVSDGWWGTKRVIDKQAKADKVQLHVNLFYVAAGRSEEVKDGLLKALNKGYGNYKFNIQCKGKSSVVIDISR